MRASTDGERQVMGLQGAALLAAGVDERYLFGNRAEGRAPIEAAAGRA